MRDKAIISNLTDKASELIYSETTVSTGFFQRTLNLNYWDAFRVKQQLIKNGQLSDTDHNGKNQVLISQEL